MDTQQQLKAILLGSISLLRALLPRIPIKIDLRLHPRATTVSPVVPLVFKGYAGKIQREELEDKIHGENVSFPKYLSRVFRKQMRIRRDEN